MYRHQRSRQSPKTQRARDPKYAKVFLYFAFFDQRHQKNMATNPWIETDSLFVLSNDAVGASKIAAFDLDDTLVSTSGKHRFPKTFEDWVWLDGKIPAILYELVSKGFKLVIFTNQLGISKGHVSSTLIKQRIENILDDLSLPVQVFAFAAIRMSRPWARFSQQQAQIADKVSRIIASKRAAGDDNIENVDPS